jgi:hypothetical protein
VTATNVHPQRSASPQVDAAQLAVLRKAARYRSLLERVADAIDLALDSDWRVAIDIMLDISDEIHAELVP